MPPLPDRPAPGAGRRAGRCAVPAAGGGRAGKRLRRPGARPCGQGLRTPPLPCVRFPARRGRARRWRVRLGPPSVAGGPKRAAGQPRSGERTRFYRSLARRSTKLSAAQAMSPERDTPSRDAASSMIASRRDGTESCPARGTAHRSLAPKGVYERRSCARPREGILPGIDGIAKRVPALLQPHVGHALLLDPGEQQKLAHRAAQNAIRQRVRRARPVHDVAREIHARVGSEFANARPFACCRHHRVLCAALRRPAAHEGTPGTVQYCVTNLEGPACVPQLPT